MILSINENFRGFAQSPPICLAKRSADGTEAFMRWFLYFYGSLAGKTTSSISKLSAH
mgnify:FL=1|jgi:hypothetical protein